MDKLRKLIFPLAPVSLVGTKLWKLTPRKLFLFPTNHFNATFKSLSRVAWIRLNMEALVETITVYLCWLQIFLIFSNSSCSHGENGAYLNRSQWARRRLDFLNFRLKILVHELKMLFYRCFFTKFVLYRGFQLTRSTYFCLKCERTH